MKRWLLVLLVLVLSIANKANGQSIVQTYIDPCDNKVYTVTFPLPNNSVTVVVRGKAKVFTYIEAQSGAIQVWVNSIFATPCPTNTVVTQTVTQAVSQAASQAATAAATAASAPTLITQPNAMGACCRHAAARANAAAAAGADAAGCSCWRPTAAAAGAAACATIYAAACTATRFSA